jgi:hypothetical protein
LRPLNGNGELSSEYQRHAARERKIAAAQLLNGYCEKPSQLATGATCPQRAPFQGAQKTKSNDAGRRCGMLISCFEKPRKSLPINHAGLCQSGKLQIGVMPGFIL